MDLPEEILMRGRSAGARLAQEGVERGQLVAVPHEHLDAHVDDVGQVFLGQCRVVERLLQKGVAVAIEGLDAQEFAHDAQVFAPGVRGVVAAKHVPVG